MSQVIPLHGDRTAVQVATRGYAIIYREDQPNFCPGCSRSHWYIGRMTAECAYCGTAVPLRDLSLQATSGGHSRNRKTFIPDVYAA
jgi:hypothetical protein